MYDACFFSKLDAFTEYWHGKVDKESSHLLAFGSPLRRYRFKRLSYRNQTVSDFSKEEINSIISDVPSRALPENNEHLNKIYLKIRKSGLKLNKNKGQIRVKSICRTYII